MNRLRRWLRVWPLGTAPVRLREVGPHEHRYESVFGLPAQHGPWPPGVCPGYRCRCGKLKPHEHRYEAVIVYPGAWTETHAGMMVPPMGMIAGYRCRCGKPRPFPRYAPSDHVRAALRYMRRRYW